MTLYLVKAALKRDASVAALAPLLLPTDDHARTLAAHRLVWSLMPSDAAATRDFLWREEAPGRFMLLAARPPAASTLFDVCFRPFEPALDAGERLHFVLRANPTVVRPGTRARRDDVVMRALHAVPGRPADQRATARPELITAEGAAWLDRVGARHGFRPDSERLAVDGYETVRIARRDARPIAFAKLDFQGVLSVTEPARFLTGLAAGFGRARAFGCGLMLIRRLGSQG